MHDGLTEVVSSAHKRVTGTARASAMAAEFLDESCVSLALPTSHRGPNTTPSPLLRM